MANDKNFKIKNGLSVGTRYLQTGGTETAGTEGYNLGSASYDSKSFSVNSQEGSPRDVAFKPDGTKMYVCGADSESAYQYTLATAWDVSTASYDSVSFSFSSQGLNPGDMFFKSDGTKMYVCMTSNDTIFQYSLSTAWDLSTASYDSKSFSVATQDSSPFKLSFKTDGTKMYVVGDNTDVIYQYSLSTAWDVSTASYDSVSFSLSQDPQSWGFVLSSDGTEFLTLGYSNSSVFKYTLSTAWDISSASYTGSSLSFSFDSIPIGLGAKTDGAKIYIVGDANKTIYQYSTALLTQTLDLSTGTYFSFTPSGATTVSFTNAPASGKAVGFAVEINGDGSAITWPSSVKWPSGVAPTATASKEVYAFVTVDGGASYYGKRAGQDIA